MAKAMRNAIRDAAKVSSQNESLIKKALEEGYTTRSTISNYTGLSISVVSNMLSNNQDLRNEWIVRKRRMVDTSIDNIEDIINDPKHKDHFQASKWVASNVDSELSHILFPQVGDLSITLPGADESDSSPVVINFTGGKKKLED